MTCRGWKTLRDEVNVGGDGKSGDCDFVLRWEGEKQEIKSDEEIKKKKKNIGRENYNKKHVNRKKNKEEKLRDKKRNNKKK